MSSHFQEAKEQSEHGGNRYVSNPEDRIFLFSLEFTNEVFLLVDDKCVSQVMAYEEQIIDSNGNEATILFATDYAPEDQEFSDVQEEDRDDVDPYQYELFAKGQWRMTLSRVEVFLNEFGRDEAYVLEKVVLEDIIRGQDHVSWV